MKKIDTHVHTSEVSKCGRMSAQEIVTAYKRAGYGAIVITDHLKLSEIAGTGMKPYEIVEHQLKGYLAARESAGSDIEVFLGAEIRFTSGDEDYLLIGLDEQKYFELARQLPDDPKSCRELMKSLDCLIYQAHPFRPGLTPASPDALDGIEVYNGNPRHDSHNDAARLFAERHHLKMLSGSDSHRPEDVARGGILTPDWVRSSSALVRFLRETPRPHMIIDGTEF